MGKKALNVALMGLPYSAHPISWYRPKFTGIDKHQTSSHQTHNLRGRKKHISTNNPFTSGKCWLRIKALFTWRNYSYQTFLLPLYCVCAGWAGLCQRCIGTWWESEKPDLEEILIWIPSEMENRILKWQRIFVVVDVQIDFKKFCTKKKIVQASYRKMLNETQH